MDEGTKTTKEANSHASVGAMTGHVTGMTVLVVSPASARSATTNWEIGWSRTTGWIQRKQPYRLETDGQQSEDQHRQGQQRQHRVGVAGSGAIRSAANDSDAPITITNTQKPAM